MKAFLRIWNALAALLAALAVILALLSVGIRLTGMQIFTVPAGTLTSAYEAGTMILVKDAKPDALQAGDMVTFLRDADAMDTGRIAAVEPDETDPAVIRFRMEDGTLVHSKNVVGIPALALGRLGYLADFVHTPAGTFSAVLFGAALLLLVFLPELLSGPGKKRRRNRGGKYLK